jgi:hypothetical protein
MGLLAPKVGSMSLVIKDKVYEQMTEGLHNVTITKVEDLGLQETNFGTKDRARIVFTAADQKDKEGRAVDVLMTVTKSLHSKSALGKLLTSLGVTVGAEFDLNDIVGTKCQVVVQHKESEGRTYANIASVLKIRKPAAAESF